MADPVPVANPGAVATGALVQPSANPADGGMSVHVDNPGAGTGPTTSAATSVAVVDANASGGLTFGGTATGTAALMITAWAQSTSVVAGQVVQNGGDLYLCTTAGTTASTGLGPSGVGAGIADGSTVKWTGYLGTAFRGIIFTDTDTSNPIYLGWASTITAGGVASGEAVIAGTTISLPAGINIDNAYTIASGSSVNWTAMLTF
jgi:hypothetical protein